MAIERYQVSLKAILRNETGCILGLNGRVGGAFEGYYDLPGGRIDEGECTTPILEIIQREVREELGSELCFTLDDVPIAIGRHQSKEGQWVFYVMFEGTVDNPEAPFTISAEHAGWAWLDLSSQPLETFFVSGILEGMKQWYTATH